MAEEHQCAVDVVAVAVVVRQEDEADSHQEAVVAEVVVSPREAAGEETEDGVGSVADEVTRLRSYFLDNFGVYGCLCTVPVAWAG